MKLRNVYLINLSFGLAGIERRFANLWHVLRTRGNVRPILVVPDTMAQILHEADLADPKDDLLWVVPEHPFLRASDKLRLPPFGKTVLAILRSRAVAWGGYQSVWDHIHKDPSAVIHIGMNCSALRPPNVPIVYECVDSTLTQLGKRHFIRAAARPSIIHCQTERIRIALEQTMARRRTHWTTVTSPCCFASYPITKPARKRDPQLVAFVGRLSPEKNPLLFIDAIAQVRSTGVACRGLILGEGPLLSDVRRSILHLGLDSAIEVGFSDRPVERLEEVSVFVSLQSGDNYPSQSLLEAMGAGCAIVATDVGETRQIVNNEVGLVVKPDISDVAGAILSLVKDPELARVMGSAAARLVRTRHTADNYAAFVESLYDRAVEAYRSASVSAIDTQ